MVNNPFKDIKKKIEKDLPSELIKYLPKKWEKIGDIVIIKIDSKLNKHKLAIGETYSKVLKCKTILNDIGGIKGELRQPKIKFIYGDKDTITVHKENNIKFKLDPQKIMFSSGNMNERIRMATISNSKETVVDLFAGIGYFSLPIAVYSKPKKIIAFEKNSISFSFLKENIVLNHVTEIVEPVLGDCRKVAPHNIADRVILGYFGNTYKFLQTALNCLKNETGIIHYHDIFPEENIPKKAMTLVKEKIKKDVKLINYNIVKSYAPGIKHVVFDIKIG